MPPLQNSKRSEAIVVDFKDPFRTSKGAASTPSGMGFGVSMESQRFGSISHGMINKTIERIRLAVRFTGG
jgi:hypothetical protein